MSFSLVLQLNSFFYSTRCPFGTELLVGQLWLSTLKVQLDLGLLTSLNISKPMFTSQAIWSVRSHTLRMSSPILSSGLFAILAFRPLSALIDAPDYSGTHPRILAQSQHHILCKSPHPLPRLQAPVCLPIMGSRIEPQWSIPTQTTRTNTNQQVLSPKTLHSGPDSSNSTSLSLALHLIHIQSHLPTPKGPCLLSY